MKGTATPVAEMLSAALPTSHELEVGLHPGQQQQQQNAELRNAVEHRFLFGSARKESVLQLGPQRSQHRGSKHDAAEQLTEG
jgi:hypothetical protein